MASSPLFIRLSVLFSLSKNSFSFNLDSEDKSLVLSFGPALENKYPATKLF